MLGYWKKEPVALVPTHHPDNKDKNLEIVEIEVDEDESIARLIDPSTNLLLKSEKYVKQTISLLVG